MATSTQDWIDELKSISVLELSERIKALEEEFGVSATAVAAAAPAGGGGGGDADGRTERLRAGAACVRARAKVQRRGACRHPRDGVIARRDRRVRPGRARR